MEKNIAALMREDTRTVQVTFDQVANDFDEIESSPPAAGLNRAKSTTAKSYTYVTDLDLVVGDTVVVEARGLLALARVRSVDDDVAIEPNADTKFKWVVAKVDQARYLENVKRNAEIEEAVANAYRHNLRRSFAQNILAALDDASRGRIGALLGGKKEAT